MSELPTYDNLFSADALSPLELQQPPPDYSPSIQHLSLNFLCKEDSTLEDPKFKPVIVELNSTQLNVYDINPYYERYAMFFFVKLLPSYIDPQLNIKSSYRPNLNHERKKSNEPTKERAKKKFHNIFKKLSPASKPSQYNNSRGHLTWYEQHSDECEMIHKLLIARPNLLDLTSSKPLSEINPNYDSLKMIQSDNLIYSASLQELIKFGNASDYHDKPFTLRLLFPAKKDCFLITCYNSRSFVELYYKLNIARELSLELDWRLAHPIDHCSPRRRRGGNRRIRSPSVNQLNLPPNMIPANNNATTGIRRRASTIGSVASSDTRCNDSLSFVDDDYDEDDADFNLDDIEPTAFDEPIESSLSQLPEIEEHLDAQEDPKSQDAVKPSTSTEPTLTSIELVETTESSFSRTSSIFTNSLQLSDSVNTTNDSLPELPDVNSYTDQSSDYKHTMTPGTGSTGLKYIIRREIQEYRELVYVLRCMRPFKLHHLEKMKISN